MKTNILMERETDSNLSDALARGALLWAPLYSIGAAAVIHSMAAEHPAEAAAFSEILMQSLLILSPLCMLLEAAGWAVFSKMKRLKKLGDRSAPLPELQHFVPPLEAARVRSHA